jgi:hypothetical protein
MNMLRPDAQYLGTALAVERRYIDTWLAGAQEAGLKLEGDIS